MGRPKVFVSHVTQEHHLADLIKNQVTQDFLGMIDVFVSSDQVSITVGSKWLNEIDDALKTAQIELILCSHESIQRPWINFEAGAGWVKGIPVVPVCHTGLRPVDLPIPLNMLQGFSASEKSGWEKVYSLLARQLGSAKPAVDLEPLVVSVREFEEEYGVVRVVAEAVRALITLLPNFEELFRPDAVNSKASGDIPDFLLDKMRPHLQLMQSKGLIAFATGPNKLTFSETGGGNVIELKIEVLPTFRLLAGKVMPTQG